MAWGPLSGSSSQVITSAGEAFSPDQISDLEAWYTMSVIGNLFQNTDFTNPVTANDDPIASILDNSDNDVDLIRGGASGTEPTYETAGINSNPAADFDGGDYWKAQSNDPISFTNEDPFSGFVVFTTPSNTVYDPLLAKGDGTVQWNFGLGNNQTGKLSLHMFSNDGNLKVRGSTAFVATTTYAVAFTYNGSKYGAGVKLYVNDSQETEVVTSEPVEGTINGAGPYFIGFDVYNALVGKLGEALVFSKELSESELTDLYDYFKTTYGYA